MKKIRKQTETYFANGPVRRFQSLQWLFQQEEVERTRKYDAGTSIGAEWSEVQKFHFGCQSAPGTIMRWNATRDFAFLIRWVKQLTANQCLYLFVSTALVDAIGSCVSRNHFHHQVDSPSLAIYPQVSGTISSECS